MKTIPAGEFKAKCLGIMEEVHESGQTIIVTKRGVPMAMVVPYKTKKDMQFKLFGIFKDNITINGNIIESLDEKWDASE